MVIGIVVVSHSRQLGNAAVDLANEMVAAGSRPQIAVAAGLDEMTLGTDAAAISEAITAVDSPDGVLVLVDLG
ncbi:MAG: dihydroxyacetone kinase, partial [Propionibacteriaceae bacterium]|nr:dihydroxyacetone kinase [Propionibacteriaceae bacterium]